MNDACKHLDDYLEGLLDERSRESFSRHLSSCSDCKREFDLEKNLDCQVQQAWNSVVAPASLQAERRSGTEVLSLKPGHNAQALTLWASIAGIAALVAIVIYGVGSLRNQIGDERKLSVNAPDAVEAEANAESPVMFSAEGLGRNTIMVKSQTSNRGFTIVKVYPVVEFSTSNSPLKGNDNEVTN